jgi:predicted Zn finger-like uncharacterized protein
VQLTENGDPLADGPDDPRPEPLAECPRCGPDFGGAEFQIGSDGRARVRCTSCGYRLG